MSGYDFSPLYHASQLAFSPGSIFLATSHLDRLIIRLTNNLSIIRTWHLAPSPHLQTRSISKPEIRSIDSVQWSDDGLYLLVFCKTEGVALVFSLTQEGDGMDGEVARIEGSGVEGSERVEWGKGGREVLGWGEHGLKLMIYSLPTGQTSYIQYPKMSSGCHSYSPDHRYFAIVERHSGKDCIGVYDTSDQFQLVRHFPLQATDAQTIKWSPCGRYIAVVDTHISYSLYIHSPIGPVLTHFSPFSSTFSSVPSALSTSQSPSGQTSELIHEDPGLGIRHIAWAPGGQYLLLMGWDGRVRVLEAEGWRCLAVLGNGSPGRVGKGLTVWREPEGWIKDTRGRGIVQFDQIPSTSQIPTTSNVAAPHSSQLSTQAPLLISPSGRHFAYLPPTNPSVINIYSLLPSPGSLPDIEHKATIVFSRSIRGFQWAGGGKERIGVICRKVGKGNQDGDGAAVYIWDEEGWEDVGQEEKDGADGGIVEGVGIPNGEKFNMSDLCFSPDGNTLALRSRGEFCLMYNTDDDPDTVTGVERVAQNEKEWETEGLSFVREEEEED